MTIIANNHVALDAGPPAAALTSSREPAFDPTKEAMGTAVADPTYSTGTRSGVQNWVNAFRASVSSIRALKDGWAGPDSKATDPRVLYIVENYLGLALARVPNPQLPYVVPSADGGLQIEWHRDAMELEVLFAASGRITALLEVPGQGVEIENEGHAAVDLLLHWAPRAAKTSSDAAIQASAPSAPMFALAA